MTLYTLAIAGGIFLIAAAVWFCIKAAKSQLAQSEALAKLMSRNRKSDGIDEDFANKVRNESE